MKINVQKQRKQLKNIIQSEQHESTKHEEEIKEAAKIAHESKHHGDKEMNEEWTATSHPLLAGNSEDRGYKETTDVTEGSENEIDEKAYQQEILVKRTEYILPNEGSKTINSTPMSEHQEGVSDPKLPKVCWNTRK